MSSFKLVCVAATLAASLAAGSALADCTRSQEVALGQAATRTLSDQTAGAQHQKQIIIHDCDATDDGKVGAQFTYRYYNEQGLQSVNGTVKTDNGRVTTLDTGKHGSFAWRDDRWDYEDSTLGRYSYR